MFRFACFGVFALSFITSGAHSQPDYQWSRAYASDNVEVLRVALDANGNLFLAGGLTGPLATDQGTLNASSRDVLLMSFDPSGAMRWAHVYSGPNQQLATALEVAPDGSILVGGWMNGSVDFGGGQLTSAGQADIFLARFANDGSHIWSKRFGGAQNQYIQDLSVNSSGVIAISGDTPADGFSFGGPSMGTCPFQDPQGHCLAGTDPFVAVFAIDGTHLWSKKLEGRNNQTGAQVAVGPHDEIFIGGYYESPYNLGGGELPDGGQRWNVYVAKYSPTGDYMWSRGFGDYEREFVSSLAVDNNGNPLVAGEFIQSIKFGGQTIIGGDSGYLAKFDADGNEMWIRVLVPTENSGQSQQRVNFISVGPSGDISLAGSFSLDVDIDGHQISNIGWWQPYVASLDASGNFLWSDTYPATDGSALTGGFAVGPGGTMVIAGVYWGSITFGGPTFSNANHDFASGDLFVAQFGSPVPVLVTEFNAVVRAGHVDVSWKLWSDEPMESYALYRKGPGDPTQVQIAAGVPTGGAGSFSDNDVKPGATYQYQVAIQTRDGDTFRSQTATATVPALKNALAQSVPNPFKGSTLIEYTLFERTHVAIGIYDVRGARVARIEQGTREAGTHRVAWDARDVNGRDVTSGVYFYRLEGVRGAEMRKMILMR